MPNSGRNNNKDFSEAKRAELRAKKGRKGGAGAASTGGGVPVPAATGGRTPVSGGPAPGPAGAVGEGLGGVKPTKKKQQQKKKAHREWKRRVAGEKASAAVAEAEAQAVHQATEETDEAFYSRVEAGIYDLARSFGFVEEDEDEEDEDEEDKDEEEEEEEEEPKEGKKGPKRAREEEDDDDDDEDAAGLVSGVKRMRLDGLLKFSV